MLPFMRAIFFELQFFLNIAPVFAGSIITPFAFTALKGYKFYNILFTRHNKPLYKLENIIALHS